MGPIWAHEEPLQPYYRTYAAVEPGMATVGTIPPPPAAPLHQKIIIGFYLSASATLISEINY